MPSEETSNKIGARVSSVEGWVVKDAELVNASYGARRDELRVLDVLVVAYRSNPESWPWVVLSEEMLYALFPEISSRSARNKFLVDALNRLSVLAIKVSDRISIGAITIMPEWKMMGRQIFVRFSEEAEPLLRTFSTRPVGYPASENSRLGGVHSLRVLEWVREAVGRGVLELTVEDIRFRLKLDESTYHRSSMLISRCIDDSIAPINEHTSFRLACERLYQGRVLTGVRIVIDHTGPEKRALEKWAAVEELISLGLCPAEAKMVGAEQDVAVVMAIADRIRLSHSARNNPQISLRDELMEGIASSRFPLACVEPNYVASEAAVLQCVRKMTLSELRKIEFEYMAWLHEQASVSFRTSALHRTGLNLNRHFQRRAFVAFFSSTRQGLGVTGEGRNLKKPRLPSPRGTASNS
ncbi:MAG: RepB family plasmid replication initiator protein [Rhizobium sp.]|nr:MAG: RepB family plasmid replication initiator protein [Rhizobium sp.]